MKIGLISPKSQFWGANRHFREYWHNNPNTTYSTHWSGLSLGLLVVAALTPEKHEVEFIDENLDEIDFGREYDLVGITCMTQQATRAYAVADEFRKRQSKVVLGGIHPTVLPQEAKTHADTVVVGEVEYVWEKMLRDLEASRLRDFYKADKLVDMKDSPPPRLDLLDPKKYSHVWIQASRGCPHDCTFCAASKVYGRRYREKPNQQIIQELESAKSIFGNVWYHFSDDNFIVNRSRRRRLLKQLGPLNVRWAAQTDISIAEDDELLSLAYQSGCRSLFIGLESLNKVNLRSVENWKDNYLQKYSEYVQKIQSHGIGVNGAFIVGFDEDDASTFDAITDFVATNHLWGVQVAVATPFPGTRLRDRLQAEGRITSADWDNYTAFDVNFVPKKLTKEELERGVVQVYQKVTDKATILETMKYFKNIHTRLQGQSA